jgi:1-acyl-sn-glycerol-3-phosphate acyltransferase
MGFKVQGLRAKVGHAVASPVFKKLLQWGFSLSVSGTEHLPKKPCVLAGNHNGFLDSLLVLAAYPHVVWFFMADKVLRWPVVGPVVWWIPNKILVNPTSPRQSLQQAAYHLNQGHTVCIFPEGKLTVDGHLNAFQPGVALIQKQTGVPIVPFTITGGYEAWRWGQWLPKRSSIHATFHSPIVYEESRSRQKLVDMLYTAVSEALPNTLANDLAKAD